MRIIVRTFAGLRDRLGRSEWPVEDLAAGATVKDLIDRLERDWPVLLSYPLAVARNRELVARDAPLHDGDEVALLPPVSGG